MVEKWMAYRIDLTLEAQADLAWLTKREQVEIIASLSVYLAHQPAMPSRRRKALAPNPLGARWELRLDELRVYYDIHEDPVPFVRVLRIRRKHRSRVVIRGIETDMREVDEQP